MSRWWKGSVVVLAVTALCAVALTSTATAQPSETTAARTLTIYGLGGRDDVAQGRLDIANRLMDNMNVAVSNPVGGFSDQVFSLIADVASGQASKDHWVTMIEKVSL